MRSFIVFLLVVVGVLSLYAVASAAESRTNIVLIMTDDQGVWSLGCYGNAEAHTPAVDRMAAGGVRFTQAFSTIPVCSPSRATFFTGRIPSQHGIHDWISHENDGERARFCLPDEAMLSTLLAQGGYTCGLFGKWHLGESAKSHAGYTYWFTFPSGSSRYQDADMYWQGKTIKTTGYLTDRITDRAIEFMDLHKDRPFFMNVQYNAPHTPYEGHPQELVDLFKDCPFNSVPKPEKIHPWAIPFSEHIGKHYSLARYYAACTGVDRGVDRILKRLDKLGLAENTLVVYASDQGFCCGHHGTWGKGNGTTPRNIYDTSLQIPLIFRHKGRLPAGQTRDVLFGGYDLLPTLLDYVGLPPSPGRNLPGRSLAPTLRGNPQEEPDAVYAEYGRARMIRTRTHKLVHRCDGGPDEYYDLRNDPGEANNLVGKPEHLKGMLALRARLFAWFKRYVEAGSDPVGHEYFSIAQERAESIKDQ